MLAALLLTTLLAATPKDPGKTFTHPDLGYTVLHPSDWTVNDRPELEGDDDKEPTEEEKRDRRNRGSAPKLTEAATNFFAPLAGEDDLFPEMLSVYAHELERPLPVNLAAEVVKIFMEAIGANLEHRKAGIRFAGQDAEELTWSMTVPHPLDDDRQLSLRAVQYVIVSNNYALAATFIFEADQIGEYRPTFETMRDSFRVQ